VAKAKTSLLDDVLARTKNHRPGFATWFQKLPPEAQTELDRVRQAFDHAKHQKRAYAKAIIEAARERGWQISGPQGVIAWLEGRR
jgi:2-hydroxychromene-2-carboxylate isomerase